jgi:hypothetical protein
MFKFMLARLICDVSECLLDIGYGLYTVCDHLWRPLSNAAARKILYEADPRSLEVATEKIRRGLRWGLLLPRTPFADRKPTEIAGFPEQILLDIYAGEIASLLLGWRIYRWEKPDEESLPSTFREVRFVGPHPVTRSWPDE